MLKLLSKADAILTFTSVLKLCGVITEDACDGFGITPLAAPSFNAQGDLSPFLMFSHTYSLS